MELLTSVVIYVFRLLSTMLKILFYVDESGDLIAHMSDNKVMQIVKKLYEIFTRNLGKT